MTEPRSNAAAGRGAPRASTPSREPGLARTAWDASVFFCRQKPGVVLGVVAVIGCGGAISWNALTQKSRHPAPLFGRAVEPPRRPDLAYLAPPPLPVRRPEAALLAPSVPAPPAAPAQAEAPAPRSASSDPIGALIRGSAASENPSKLVESGRIAQAQKALSKLGYGPLKADGQMGATTKQALEKFERDQKLPVTGGLGTRTIRQLASMSGSSIE